MNDNTHYSELLDTIIECGAAIAHGNETLVSVTNVLDKIIKPGVSITNELARFAEDINACRRRLDNPELLRIEPSCYTATGMSIWPSAMHQEDDECCPQGFRLDSILLHLDLTVYLQIAFTDLPILKNIQEYTAASEKVQQIENSVASDPEPSWPRLIPFNRLRRTRLRNIPPQVHYLFPWYLIWSEEPSETLDQFLEQLKIAKKEGSIPFDIHPALLAEIKDDKQLLNYILTRRNREIEFEEILLHGNWLKNDEAIALRLFHAADNEAAHTVLPEKIIKSEALLDFGEGCLQEAMYNRDAVLHGKDFAQFRRAFCDRINIDAPQRMQALEDIRHYANGSKQASWFDELFADWRQDDPATDAPLATAVFRQWVKDIEILADDMRLSAYQTPEVQSAATGLNYEYSTRYAEAPHLQTRPPLPFQPDFELGDTENEEISDLQLTSKDIGASLIPLPTIDIHDDGFSKTNILKLLPPEENVADKLATLCKVLRAGRFFWRARYALSWDIWKNTTVQSGNIPLLFPADQLEPKESLHDIQVVILAISPDKGILEKVFEKLEKPSVKTKKKSEKKSGTVQEAQYPGIIFKIFIKVNP